MTGTREARIAKQQGDSGDPEDTVYLAAENRNGGSTYHDGPECFHLRKSDGYTEVPRETAQNRWKAPCKTCVLDGGESA